MNKLYVKPTIKIEHFIATEYISACYYGPCNADGFIFSDTNSDGVVNGDDSYIYQNIPCDDNGFFIRNVDSEPPTNALVFTEEQIDAEYAWHPLFKEYVVSKVKGLKPGEEANGTPAWRYKKQHTSTELNLQKRPNHS